MKDPAPHRLDAVVFDLDGVIRHWNDDELDAHGALHGLPPRAILDVGFSDTIRGRYGFIPCL